MRNLNWLLYTIRWCKNLVKTKRQIKDDALIIYALEAIDPSFRRQNDNLERRTRREEARRAVILPEVVSCNAANMLGATAS